MAINNDNKNPLYSVNDTSVKFYSSLTRNQAKGLEPIGKNEQNADIFVEPGAVCFVSDSAGNSIFLNRRLFGDGAVASGTTGGGSDSGGSGGLTEVHLSDLIVVQKDGQTLKTLSDYFNADGTFLTESLIITNTLEDGSKTNVITIDSTGIKIGEDIVVTQSYVNDAISDSISNIDSKIQSAKDYASSLVSSVYKVKGSVNNYSDLVNITNPSIGDVYNVRNEYKDTTTNKIIPAGTNYVYTESGWDALGGTFDVSNFYTRTEVNNLISDAETNFQTQIQSQSQALHDLISANTTSIGLLSTTIASNSVNIAANTTNIETNTQNISQISTQLTWQ